MHSLLRIDSFMEPVCIGRRLLWAVVGFFSGILFFLMFGTVVCVLGLHKFAQLAFGVGLFAGIGTAASGGNDSVPNTDA